MNNCKKLTAQLKFDQELTPREVPSERVLEITLQAPEAEGTPARPVLNLALVLDRSGSMAGDKLEFAKKAADHVVNLLQVTDRVALVEYDDTVKVLFPGAFITPENRVRLHRSIQSLHPGGSTNLCDGWLTGSREVAEVIGDGKINHTLLLTDGLANVGITDLEELAVHARELAARGVTTSTFGVGRDFDQHLLEAMANRGGGQFFFIESPEDIPNIFSAEFKDLITLFARNVEVTLSHPPNVQVKVLGDWHSDSPEPGKLRVFLGSLVSGRRLEFYISVSIASGLGDPKLPFKVSVLAKGEKGQLLEAVAEGSLQMSSREEAEAAPKDVGLLERYARVELADRAAEALKLEKRGLRPQASAMLRLSLDKHRNKIDTDLSQNYQAVSDRMARGMDELDRKRIHSETYAQKQRREEYVTYLLERHVKGHLVFDVQGHKVVLDTGSPVSIGTQVIRFMGRSTMFKADYLGVNTEYLSRVIGMRIHFLLGMDVLHNLSFQIDSRKGEVNFSYGARGGGKTQFPLGNVLNVPTAMMNVAGSPRKIIIDTSAKLSYLRKSVLAGLEKVDTEKDFYPGIGDFETDVFLVPLEMGGKITTLRCGVLPPVLEMTLLSTRTDGILGTELYDSYIATFNLPEQILSLDRYTD